MNPTQPLQSKILNLSDLQQKVQEWKLSGKKIVFTNGCFDLLHPGHVFSLQQAATYGDILVVGLNADVSVKKLKGADRPIHDELSRATILAALSTVDAVVIFSESTPINLITAIQPDFLVKGGDYKIEDIAGAKEVIGWGGEVILIPIVEGFSTSAIINKLNTASRPDN